LNVRRIPGAKRPQDQARGFNRWLGHGSDESFGSRCIENPGYFLPRVPAGFYDVGSTPARRANSRSLQRM